MRSELAVALPSLAGNTRASTKWDISRWPRLGAAGQTSRALSGLRRDMRSTLTQPSPARASVRRTRNGAGQTWHFTTREGDRRGDPVEQVVSEWPMRSFERRDWQRIELSTSTLAFPAQRSSCGVGLTESRAFFDEM